MAPVSQRRHFDVRPDTEPTSGTASPQPASDPWLRLIALFKLVKSFLFICAGIGLLHFLNKDIEAYLLNMMDDLHVDSDNHFAKWVLDSAAKITAFQFLHLKGVAFLSAVAFFYAILFGIEGIGLYLRKRWAEWFVVIMTSTLLPLEGYEIWHKVTLTKIALTIGNLLILGYLIIVIRRKQEQT